MAKKFGKLLLFSAAIGSAIGAVCYYVRKKNTEQDNVEEEDYDDFSDDEKETTDTSRNYVPLNTENQATETQCCCNTPSDEAAPTDEAKEESDFTPLAEKVAETAQKAEETVEEFFDEDDSTDEEPPVSDN